MQYNKFFFAFSLIFPFISSTDIFTSNPLVFKRNEAKIYCFPKSIDSPPDFPQTSSSFLHPIEFTDPSFKENFICMEQEIIISNETSRQLQQNLTCNASTCPNGMCDTTNRCFCSEHYATWMPSEGVECNYKQKSRYGALILEFFFWMETGAGYFYLGYTALGVGQLILFFPAMVVFCIMGCCFLAVLKEKASGALACCGMCFTVLWLFGCIAWWLYAVIAMGKGDIIEANGAPTSESVYV